MIYQLKISPIANIELLDSIEWYNTQKDKLGFEFFHEIENAFELIKKNPLLFAKIYKDFRMLLINRFPFEVFYSIEDNMILIHHIFHSSRNPKIWKKKLDK